MTLQGKIYPVEFTLPIEDPFILVAHHSDDYPPGDGNMGPNERPSNWIPGDDLRSDRGYKMYHGTRVPGFPAHPHRGFETITYARKGMIDHFDSLGNYGRYGDGDVQWMTSGKGMQHAEMFPLLNTEANNPFEIVQIWFNLPQKHKMVSPVYKMIWNEEIPRVPLSIDNPKENFLKLIIGRYQDKESHAVNEVSWAKDPNNYVNIWEIQIQAGNRFNVPHFPDGIKVQLYLMNGRIKVNENEINEKSMFVYISDTNTEFEILEDATMMIFTGRPISQPMVAYGPFVMNSQEEIREAYQDFYDTEFGGWPWDSNAPTIESTKGRFSMNQGGTLLEEPPQK